MGWEFIRVCTRFEFLEKCVHIVIPDRVSTLGGSPGRLTEISMAYIVLVLRICNSDWYCRGNGNWKAHLEHVNIQINIRHAAKGLSEF